MIPKKEAATEWSHAYVTKSKGAAIPWAWHFVLSVHLKKDANREQLPQVIIDAMIGSAKDEKRSPARVVDAGAGSGRFTLAAAIAFPKAQLVAVEIDPLATLLLRAYAAVCGFAHRLSQSRNLEGDRQRSRVSFPRAWRQLCAR